MPRPGVSVEGSYLSHEIVVQLIKLSHKALGIILIFSRLLKKRLATSPSSDHFQDKPIIILANSYIV